jgi:hypothetical protein
MSHAAPGARIAGGQVAVDAGAARGIGRAVGIASFQISGGDSADNTA